MSLATELPWTDKYLSGFKPMDDTHREFVAFVNALLTAEDAAMAGVVAKFERHTEAHFRMEAEWMEETAFPARQCHLNEHDSVLKSVREVHDLVSAGDVAVARRLAAELLKWFPGHVDYLDLALAQWLVKKRHGGAPVVLKRDLSRTAPMPEESCAEDSP